MAQPRIAIIGSGPSGCYSAQFLTKHFKDASITIFDRLAVPYGLVRFGVAPDHVGTKAVTQQFDRLFQGNDVKFVGSTEIGSDISFDEIKKQNDVVIVATGLSGDRQLEIPGANLSGMYGSGQITRLINSHPEESLEGIKVGKTLAIVGNGNVAIDLIRLSLSSQTHLTDHGVDPAVAQLIANGELTTIHVIGRSSIQEAKFDVAMLKELSKLEDVRFECEDVNFDLSGTAELEDPRIAALGNLIDNSKAEAKRRVRFHFGWTPTEFLGDTQVQVAKFVNSANDAEQVLEVDTVYTAIGFVEKTSATLKKETLISAESTNENGYLSEGVYCVGWFRRGPTGTIPANRADAKLVCEKIIADFENTNTNTGSRK